MLYEEVGRKLEYKDMQYKTVCIYNNNNRRLWKAFILDVDEDKGAYKVFEEDCKYKGDDCLERYDCYSLSFEELKPCNEGEYMKIYDYPLRSISFELQEYSKYQQAREQMVDKKLEEEYEEDIEL